MLIDLDADVECQQALRGDLVVKELGGNACAVKKSKDQRHGRGTGLKPTLIITGNEVIAFEYVIGVVGGDAADFLVSRDLYKQIG